ncbi:MULTISPECIES: hypothetical protein [Burkholderia cepacia complex]|uniref:Fimbrial assembly protein n=1 Tax=Burkholderia cenocepacia TaxID=95486 RepID=A0A3Q9F9V9_9BURK|nr:hypothetical protein [Burkholderia cenocepacia]AZQ53132.1 hypothetical protein D5R55_19290 [Burkholderia cenocepacia]
MKKLILAIAASSCAMSVYAENPKSIDLNVQLAGKVPAPTIFEVTPKDWDGKAKSLTVPANWAGSETAAMAEVQWDVKSSYGPVRIRLESPLQGKEVSGKNRGVLVHESGDFVELVAATTRPIGSWGLWDVLNDEEGRVVLDTAQAAKGAWVGVRLNLKAPNGVPRSGTYTGTMTATFDTDIEG